MGRLTIGVLVTNYNSWDLAMLCVNAHLKHSGRAIEKILLIDDHSDETYDGPLDPKVRVIRNEKNLGFVKSVNVGFANLDTDLVVLFDADAYPLMDYSASILRDFMNDSRLGVFGFTTYDKNNLVTGSSEEEPGILSLIIGQKLDGFYRKYFRKNPRRDVVYSCSMVVRKSAFEDVGGFDENFDWLDVDHDFCMRMRARGWKVKYGKEARAFHEGGGTPQLSSDRLLRSYKNRWYLLRKHGKIKNAFLMKSVILLRLRLEYMVLLVFRNLIFKNKTVAVDKLWGRKRVIGYCKENYK